VKALVLADRPPYAPLEELAAGCDLILTLGDLGRFELAGLERLKLPKLGVHGNHCGDYFADFAIHDLHLKVFGLYGLRFGGFEGSLRYKPGPYQYSQEEGERLLLRLPAVDVLVCHSPPYGVNDHPGAPPHEGFLGLARYVIEKRPRLLLHGHTYPLPEDLVSHVEDTDIVYVHGWAHVELPEPRALA
jgi:hypothetical protein